MSRERQEFGGILVLEVVSLERRRRCRSKEKEVSSWGASPEEEEGEGYHIIYQNAPPSL